MYVTGNIMRLTHDVVRFTWSIMDVTREVMYVVVLSAIKQP